MKDFACVILAAGEGTRMNSQTPKVLHTVYKKPLIGYILKALEELKIKKVITVCGYKSKQVAGYLGKKSLIVEQKRRLGTADALRQAEKKLAGFKGHILTLCADIPLIRSQTLNRLIALHRGSKASCTVLTSVLKNPTGYGRILRDDNNKVVKIIEEKDASLYEKVIEEINSGVYCFKAKDLFASLKEIKADNAKKEYYLTDIIEIFAKKELSISSFETEDTEEILGINSRFDLVEAHKIIRKRILARVIEGGVTIVDPETTHIDNNVEIGQDTVIEPFVRIEEDVKIGKKCRLGPFLRIRPHTVIADEVKLGNFVEVVRSTVDSGTKINHHTYIGDSRIGKKVNVGAGTITANYNGREKNTTIIKDNAFIGSGSILVAPVKIGKNAVTGANCTVVKGEVKDDTVVVGVPAKVLRKKKKQKQVSKSVKPRSRK